MDSSNDLSEELIRRLSAAGGLEEVTASEIFEETNIYEDGHDVENEPDDIIIVHMDIREPLSTLRTLVEQKIGVDLDYYSFCLQDAQELEPHKNLVDQCVKGEAQSQILRRMTGAPWYIRNRDIENELQIPKIGDVINRQATTYLAKLAGHPNQLAQRLLRARRINGVRARRRLRRVHPNDLPNRILQ